LELSFTSNKKSHYGSLDFETISVVSLITVPATNFIRPFSRYRTKPINQAGMKKKNDFIDFIVRILSMPVFWMSMLVMKALLVGEEHPPERPIEPWPDPKPVQERVVTRKINWNKKGKTTARPPW